MSKNELSIDSILRDLHGYELPLTGEVTLDVDLDFQNKLITSEIETAKQQLFQLLLEELIGEDEPVTTEIGKGSISRGTVVFTNRLRQEQRTKLHQLFNIKEDV